MPKQAPVSRARSSGRPVKVITGCSASGRAPCRVAGSSTRTPYRPLVCTTSWPARTSPAAASPSTSPGSVSSGTVSRTRSAAASTSGGGSTGVPGSSASTRRRDASDTADTATTRWPAWASAAPSTEPTRPAPTTPTDSRAGRSSTEGVGVTRVVPVLAGVPDGAQRTGERAATRAEPAVS